jgi:capsular polysaccharide biosynthesis protein
MQSTYDTPVTARAATVSNGLEAVSQRLFTAAAAGVAPPLPALAPRPAAVADPDALLPPIELREYVFVIFRHWRVPAVMVFVAAIVSATLGMVGQKTYSAVATIALPSAGITPHQVLAAGASDSVLGQLVESGQFNHMQRPMQPLAAADLRARVQVTSADNVVFSVAARDSSAAGAALLANTLAENMVRYLSGAGLTDAQRTGLAAAGIDLKQLPGTADAAPQEKFAALQAELITQRSVLLAQRTAMEAPRTALEGGLTELQVQLAALNVERIALAAPRMALEAQLMALEAQRQLPEAQRAQLQTRHGAELEKAVLLVPLQPTTAGTAIELKLEIAANLAALPELVALRNRLAGKNQAALSGFGDFSRAMLLQSQLQSAPQGAPQSALQIELLSALQNASQSASQSAPQSAPQSALQNALQRELLSALQNAPQSVPQSAPQVSFGAAEMNGVRIGGLVASIDSVLAALVEQYVPGGSVQALLDLKAAYDAKLAAHELELAPFVQQIDALNEQIVAKAAEIAVYNPQISAKDVEIAAKDGAISAKHAEIATHAPRIAAVNVEIAMRDKQIDALTAVSAPLPVMHSVAVEPDSWVEPNLRKNVLAATGAALALSLMLIFGYEYAWGGGLPGSTAVPARIN